MMENGLGIKANSIINYELMLILYFWGPYFNGYKKFKLYIIIIIKVGESKLVSFLTEKKNF